MQKPLSILLVFSGLLFSQSKPLPALKVAVDFYGHNKLEESNIECKRVISVTSNDSSNHELLHAAHWLLSNNYRELEDYESALYHFGIIIDQYTYFLSKHNLGKLYFNIGIVSMKLEQFDNALKYFQQTINEYNDPSKSYVVSAYISECYHKKGDTKNQYKWIEKTLEFDHSIGDDSLLVEIYISSTLLYLRMLDYEMAMKAIDECIVLAKSTKYFNLIGKTYELKARTLFDSKDGVKTDKRQEINRFNDVIKYADMAIEAFLRSGKVGLQDISRDLIGKSNILLAFEYQEIGDYDRATISSIAALEYYVTIKDTLLMADAYYVLLTTGLLDPEKNYQELEQHIIDATNLIPGIEDINKKEKLLSKTAYYYDFTNQREKAISVYKEAINLINPEDDYIWYSELTRNLVSQYISAGKYVDAEKILKELDKVLKINKDTTRYMESMEQRGWLYWDAGLLDDAYESYNKVIKIARIVNNNYAVANAYNNLAGIDETIGRYDKAMENAEIALSTSDDLQLNLDSKNLISLVYRSWGQYDKYLETQLEILHIEDSLALPVNYRTLNNLGAAYRDIGDRDKAFEYFNKALEIAPVAGGGTRMVMINIIECYLTLKNYDKATELLEEFWKNKDLNTITVTEYVRLELDLFYRGPKGTIESDIANLEELIDLLKIDKQQAQNFPLIARTYKYLGILYSIQNNFDKAIVSCNYAIEIYENIRESTQDVNIKRDMLEQMIGTFGEITYFYYTLGDLDAMFQNIEKSRAKSLFENLVFTERKIPLNLKYIQKQLLPKQAVIIFDMFYMDHDNQLIELLITNDTTYAFMIPDSILLKDIYPNNHQEKTLSDAINDYHLTIITSNPFEDDDSTNHRMDQISKAFYQHLLSSLEIYIDSKTELIIVPEGIMSVIPFEMLVDKDNKYLIDHFDVQYVQSLTVWEFLRQKTISSEKNMLAIGGAIYDEKAYTPEIIKNDKMLSYQRSIISDSISLRGSLEKSYASLGYIKWENLIYSLDEVNQIKSFFKKSRVINGKDANESMIKDLSNKGELSQYKMLHFATHGHIDSDIPELSAIVLSQIDDDTNDGFLALHEIEELQIDAEIVTLSACNTGLGKIYEGDGVIGLTQSFLISGANAVTVSLWALKDLPAMDFMVSMYQKIADGQPYLRAMNDTKREFILGKGKSGTITKHPLFWAPYVYYGK